MRRRSLPIVLLLIAAHLAAPAFPSTAVGATESAPTEPESVASRYSWQPGSGPRGQVLWRGGFLGDELSPHLRASNLSSAGASAGFDFPVAEALRFGFQFDWVFPRAVSVDGGPLEGARHEGSLSALSVAASFPLVAGDRAELWLTPAVGWLLPSGSVRNPERPGRYELTPLFRVGLGPTGVLWYDSANSGVGWGADRPRLGLMGALSIDAHGASLSARPRGGAEHRMQVLFLELAIRLGVVFGS